MGIELATSAGFFVLDRLWLEDVTRLADMREARSQQNR
jgi:hypothetical protein